MITNVGKITINTEYVTQWQDANGHYVIEDYLPTGRVLLNKSATGCGITTYVLLNRFNAILVSPRNRLIQNKIEQHSGIFYFNREQDDKGNSKYSIQELEMQFAQYRVNCQLNNQPMKLMVCTDSFYTLADMLESNFEININDTFRIYIDESHTLVKDCKMKETFNKGIISRFLKRLFKYEHLLFISATPIKKYIERIPEFQAYPVDYIELHWTKAAKIRLVPHNCKSSIGAFDEIYSNYSRKLDAVTGLHYFDVIHKGGGQASFSYEAAIFLNSVFDIRRILHKYINKLGLIQPSDVTIICAKKKENADALKKVHPGLHVCQSIPKRGDTHTTWTFLTSTAYEGIDLYGPTTSSYAIANYNVETLCCDIASDIPQIVGRNRVKTNEFRNTLHIYYTNKKDVITDEEFDLCRQKRYQESVLQIELWQDASTPQLKNRALQNLETEIAKYPNDYYLKTINGIPEIDELLQVAEDYSRDILKNQLNWFVIQHQQDSASYSPACTQLCDALESVSSAKTKQDRIAIVLQAFLQYPSQHGEFFQMLHNEGYGEIAKYFNALPLNRISTLGCDPWRLDQEMTSNGQQPHIQAFLSGALEKGRFYRKPDVKTVLQTAFDHAGIKKKATATDLPTYLPCKEVKLNGERGYQIL